MAAENWAVLQLAAVARRRPGGLRRPRHAACHHPCLGDCRLCGGAQRAGRRGGRASSPRARPPRGCCCWPAPPGNGSASSWRPAPPSTWPRPEFPVEIALPPLADSAAERRRYSPHGDGPVRAARRPARARRRGLGTSPCQGCLPDLSPPRYGTALAVQMAALAALLTSGHGADGAVRPPRRRGARPRGAILGQAGERRELKLADPARVYRLAGRRRVAVHGRR